MHRIQLPRKRVLFPERMKEKDVELLLRPERLRRVIFTTGESLWRPVMQLLLNLMLNAEQAVDDRQGAAITIAVTRDAESVLLTLSDNGVGLPQVQPEPFALHELSDTAPLLGLGLLAARRLAANEGGSLDLQSTGDGTTASLRLKAV